MKYLDIETVSAFKTLGEADNKTVALWEKKMAFDPQYLALLAEMKVKFGENGKFEALHQTYSEKAALFAEFNKIVCVSLGEVVDDNKIQLVNFSGDNEEEILINLSAALSGVYALVAHYGKGFDFPVLSRKYVIYRMKMPFILDNAGKKPWETGLIDTADLWKFGDMKHSASLDLLAHCFGLPSPKDGGISGADVTRVYWNNGAEGLKKIATYCNGDVVTLINVHRMIIGEAPILNFLKKD